MTENEHIKYLWQQYLADKASLAEVEDLFEYISKAANEDHIPDQIKALIDESGQMQDHSAFTSESWVKVIELIREKEHTGLNEDLAYYDDPPADNNALHPVSRLRVIRTQWFRYVAAALVVLGIGIYILFSLTKSVHSVTIAESKVLAKDIAPAREGAILTLADGTKIELDSMRNGVVADQRGSTVVLKDKVLAYDAGSNADNSILNTLTTPKGRQFRIILPDGSKAWLNAGSSITYPAAFARHERKVLISGELYFEIAQNGKAPFIVHVGNETQVQVLGTSFNVKAYENEIVNTTLLQGAVRVKSKEKVIELRPGQQARSGSDANPVLINNADIEQAVAWKNGLFNFNGYSIKAVLQEISRWYDLEVVYEEEPQQIEIVGEMQRTLTLDQVMNTLKDLNIHYRLEDRKLIITK